MIAFQDRCGARHIASVYPSLSWQCTQRPSQPSAPHPVRLVIMASSVSKASDSYCPSSHVRSSAKRSRARSRLGD